MSCSIRGMRTMMFTRARFWLMALGMGVMPCVVTLPAANADTIHLVPIGDSITQANTTHNSYRRPLWSLFQTYGYTDIDFVGSHNTNFGGPPPNPDFDLDHEGHWGWRADEILSNLPTWLAGYTPDIALIHLGTNDLAQGQSIASTILELQDIITTLRGANPDIIVFVAQIIPRTDAQQSALIDDLNDEIPTIAQTMTTAQSPIIIVDQNTGFDAALDTYDGTHPNADGEQKMADKWFEAVDAVIGCATEIDPTPPTTPLITSATAISIAQVDLTWDPAEDLDTGVCRYNIYRDGNFINSVLADQTSFSDFTVTESTLYSYEVAAVNQGDVEGSKSTPVEVTTPPELVPPTITSVYGTSTLDAVNVTFSEPVEETSAETHTNYAISNGVTISGATLAPDTLTVTLDTSTLAQGISYTLTVNNVIDRSVTGNPIAPDTQVPFIIPFRVIDGLVVFYDLEEGQGTTVHDTGGGATSIDLEIDAPSAVTWVEGGLSINNATLVQSSGPATKLINACMASNELTLETWIKPANTDQGGPARIFTLSFDGGARNFTIGQAATLFDIRLRTTATSNNGIPSLGTPGGTATTDMTHVVYTRAANGDAKAYINGIERATGNFGGDLSTWDTSFKLGLANELNLSRPWLGELHLAAVYDRALGLSEVQQNFGAGPNPIIVYAPVDYDTDGDVDAADLDAQLLCTSGALTPYTPGCEDKDLDEDGDIDLSDFGLFQLCESGEGIPANPNCLTP